MNVKVITPDQNVYEGEVTQVKLPGTSGQFEVLNDHAALISTLQSGKLILKTTDQGLLEYQVDGGVVEILKNQLIILIESISKES